MTATFLFDALRAQAEKSARPLAPAEYRGATTPVTFGNPQNEFLSLVNACGVYDLGFRARISITGNDRVRWLNGMLSNNIRDLAVGHGVYAFLLNPQGRILGEMYAYSRGEALIIETDRSQLEKIMATFDHYVIMDDVELANITEQQVAIGLMGPKSQDVLHAAGIAVPEIEPLQMINAQCDCDCGCVACTVVRGDNPLSDSYEIWLQPEDSLKTWQALVAAGASPVGTEALEMQRIAAGVPRHGVDIRERDLPQETEQARALNFNKGCYIGQEIVERIRSRGNVHRKFTGFLAETGAGIEPGAKVLADTKEVGEITSAAVLPAPLGGRMIGLGYIRREVGVPGREVMIAGAKATVIQVPIEIGALERANEAVLHRA